MVSAPVNAASRQVSTETTIGETSVPNDCGRRRQHDFVDRNQSGMVVEPCFHA